MATVKDVWNLLDRKAPFRTQMDFDNAGFLVGRGDQQVTRVLVALDITPEVIREAAEKGCQLILAHHPVIWGKVGQITDETATGRKVLALIEQGIAAICAHTNLDAAEGGVNTALALRLGLRDQVPLAVDGTDEAGRPYGVGRVGQLEGGPMTVDHFARRAKETLGLSGIRVLDAGVPVQRVAVGGGACGSMLPQVRAMGCDTFLTADLKHDLYLEAREAGMNLLDALRSMGYTCAQPEGAFYLFPRSLEPDAAAFCERARKYDLILVSGDSFGCPGHVRISYCVPTEQIQRALPKFRALAREYGVGG